MNTGRPAPGANQSHSLAIQRQPNQSQSLQPRVSGTLVPLGTMNYYPSSVLATSQSGPDAKALSFRVL